MWPDRWNANNKNSQSRIMSHTSMICAQKQSKRMRIRPPKKNPPICGRFEVFRGRRSEHSWEYSRSRWAKHLYYSAILLCFCAIAQCSQTKMLVTRRQRNSTLCHHKNMFLPLTRGGTIYKLIVQLLKNIIQSPTNKLSVRRLYDSARFSGIKHVREQTDNRANSLCDRKRFV